MRKRYCYLVSAMCAGFLLTGCQNAAGKAAEQTTQASVEEEKTAQQDNTKKSSDAQDESEISEEERKAMEDPNEGFGGDHPDQILAVDGEFYEGIWLPEQVNEYNYLEVKKDGTWTIYGDNGETEGWLGYDTEMNALCGYAYNGDWGIFELQDDGSLYFPDYGSFRYSSSLDGRLTEDQEYGSYHADVSEFTGFWYPNGNLGADHFLSFDYDGTWHYYERSAGDPEGTEMDYGVLVPAENEVSTYYADSSQYQLAYRMYAYDTNIILWDDIGELYERME